MRKLFDHVMDRDGQVTLLTVEKPKAEWSSPVEVFKDTLQHEKTVSSRIYALVELSAKEGDHPAAALLQWFVTEQVEEEATASKILQMLERIGDSGNGLFMLDRELGTRTIASGTEEK